MQLAAQHVAKARNINGFETRLDKFTVEVCGGLLSTTIWCCLDFGRTKRAAWSGLGTFPLHATYPDSAPAMQSHPDRDITLAKRGCPQCDIAGSHGFLRDLLCWLAVVADPKGSGEEGSWPEQYLQTPEVITPLPKACEPLIQTTHAGKTIVLMSD